MRATDQSRQVLNDYAGRRLPASSTFCKAVSRYRPQDKYNILDLAHSDFFSVLHSGAKFCSDKFEAFLTDVRDVHGKSCLRLSEHGEVTGVQSPLDVPFHIFDPRLPTRPQVHTQGRSKGLLSCSHVTLCAEIEKGTARSLPPNTVVFFQASDRTSGWFFAMVNFY
jgi:hypothetical protein